MKFEILQAHDKATVAQFTVQELSLLSFPQWKSYSVVEMPLHEFAAECATINLFDDVTMAPFAVAVRARFYLPTPVEDRMLNLATANGTDREKAASPSITLNAILLAVVDELKHDHAPNDQYIVRVSE